MERADKCAAMRKLLQLVAEALQGPDHQAQFQQAMSEGINHSGAAS
jgi:hypothetical protein